MAAEGVGNIDIGHTYVLLEIVTNRSHVCWNLSQSVELVPRKQELCVFTRLFKCLANEISGCYIAEIAYMNGTRRAYSRRTNIFFLIRGLFNNPRCYLF